METQGEAPVRGSRFLHILISTGEVSGDLQGSYLVQALHRQAEGLGLSLKISALGGPRMAAAGAFLVGDTTAIGSVGLLEALPFILPTLKIQRSLQEQLPQMAVDLAVFIDYMNPNRNLGKFLRRAYPNLPTAYYIAPQQWVWTFSKQESQDIADISDKMVAIFPQEATYYRQFGAEVRYFGHPLVDKFSALPSPAAARRDLKIADNASIITLLPASRWQEVSHVLPLILAVARQLQVARPTVQFLVPISLETLRPAIAAAIAQSGINARILSGQAHTAIAAADLVLSKSGTVNLEVALLNVPQIVVYRLNPLTARIAYFLLGLRVDYISPVNLFVNKPIVPEFIQWRATVESITAASVRLLEDSEARSQMLAGYRELRAAMGEPGVCDRVAHDLLSFACSRAPARS